MAMPCNRFLFVSALITSSLSRRVHTEGHSTHSLLEERFERIESGDADKGWDLLALPRLAVARRSAAFFRAPHGPGGARVLRDVSDHGIPPGISRPVSRPSVGRSRAQSVAMIDTGFVEEMRKVAMRWHSPQQAPQEGKKVATKKEEMSPTEWRPTAEGYLRFLVESKVVYDTFESLLSSAPSDSAFHDFTNTGLERSEGLEKDIAWLAEHKGLEIPEATGAGVEYAKFLTDLAKEDEAAFLCHYYNFVFAHSAGGRMIGKKVSDALLDGKVLNFYMWEDLEGSKARTKERINLLAERLSREEKDRCLEETMKAFDMSGKLLKYIAQ